ncbi:MAG: hypothetical protein PHH70_00685 [Candidatus Gracilibacteria bacterium]|nr:hypothetical protein [Candidatus Gracilibacteria bacterium]
MFKNIFSKKSILKFTFAIIVGAIAAIVSVESGNYPFDIDVPSANENIAMADASNEIDEFVTKLITVPKKPSACYILPASLSLFKIPGTSTFSLQ